MVLWVPLHLVQLNGLLGDVQDMLQLLDVEIRHTDTLHHTDALQLLHGSPGVLQLRRRRGHDALAVRALRQGLVEVARGLHCEGKVYEQEVDVAVTPVVGLAEHLQVVVGALDRRLVADGARALGGDVDLFPPPLGDGRPQRLHDGNLGPVVVGGVDVRAAQAQPALDSEARTVLRTTVPHDRALLVAAGPGAHGDLRELVAAGKRHAGHLLGPVSLADDGGRRGSSRCRQAAGCGHRRSCGQLSKAAHGGRWTRADSEI
mmetsp:Transcript_19627/g.59173  ORF Transcript_19627/g.59173 Transcript_19627/m.59173 type:complete len:260 (-) Transcript_19627:85-864(-)